jgi:hypothetical protein
MNKEDAVILWSARLQYEGLKPFIVGSFVALENTPIGDLEGRVWRLVDPILPVRPRLIKLLQGSVFFVPRDIKARTVGPYSGVSQ